MFAMHWGKEPGLYHRMQPRKRQVVFYHIIKLVEWITALTALMYLSAVGAFTEDEQYSPFQLALSSCCVPVSFLSLSIILLYNQLLLMFWTPFPPFLTSRHRIISIWTWFINALPGMPSEPFMSSMSLQSASCTLGCHPVL